MSLERSSIRLSRLVRSHCRYCYAKCYDNKKKTTLRVCPVVDLVTVRGAHADLVTTTGENSLRVITAQTVMKMSTSVGERWLRVIWSIRSLYNPSTHQASTYGPLLARLRLIIKLKPGYDMVRQYTCGGFTGGGGVRSKPLYGRTHWPLVDAQGLFVINYGENRIRVRGLFFILRGVYNFFLVMD